MTHCVYIKISRNSRGLPVRSYRTLHLDEITFGRGAENTIHLPDPRIAMHHAVLKHMEDGLIHLIAVNGELEMDHGIHQSLVLNQGRQVMVGPYRLTVEAAPPDVDIVFSMELANRLPDDYEDLQSRTHEPLPGASSFKRRSAFWLAGLITLFFLILPLAQSLIPTLHEKMSDLPFGFDRAWSPGRFSNAHLHFSSQCANCHQQATQQVSDQACLHCHRDTQPHLAPASLQQKTFQAQHRFSDGVRCAECHREHKAPHPLARQDNGMCVKCHGNLKKIRNTTTLPDIHDFDRDHPAFKLTFRASPDLKGVISVSQNEKDFLREYSGIKFPHTQHIGKVQGPDSLWDVREMTCASCHRAEGKEMRFKLISFKRDCLGCHADQLEVGPAEATLRLPHGAEDNLFNALRAQAPKQFERYSETLKNNGCAYCHDIAAGKPGDSLPWRVEPVHIATDWFTNAQFNHGMHRTQQCTACHAVEKSESSADIALPDRENCLRCHSGNSPKRKRIASTCMSCHNFHRDHTRMSPRIHHGKLSEEDVAVAVKAAEEQGGK
jgi:predicted CXXCH cytochrome family protein